MDAYRGGIKVADLMKDPCKYGHMLSLKETVPATFDSDGIIEYWYCDKCDKAFIIDDLNRETEISLEDAVIKDDSILSEGGGEILDINILLALQEFRNGTGSCLIPFMMKMSFIGEMNTVLIFIAIIYWCVSKEYGRYFLLGWTGCRVINGLLKVTACVYRPWIRDARIIPYKEAMETATGYSFPSGHSMNASALYGGGAIRRELPGILRITLALTALLIAFSRNFLGVHTPQDIWVGLGAGVLVMWLTMKLLAWLEKHPEKDILVMCLGIGISVAVAVFAAFKNYPVDYDEAGNILVDGAKMAKDTYKGAGWCIGFMTGWVLEKRYIGFSTDVPLMTRATRLVTGVMSYYAVSLIFAELVKEWIPGPGGPLAASFIQTFYITFIFPWFIKRYESARVPACQESDTFAGMRN